MPELAQIRTAWDEAARQDAMGNIITIAGLTSEQFFERGRLEVTAVMAHLKALDIETPTKLALDFGCGIGRLSVALAEVYDRVHGVDVSSQMILRAKPHVRVSYYAAETLRWVEDRTYDLIYSNIVLQHMPSDLQEGYVREFMRVLSGVAVFEIPEGETPAHEYNCQTMYGTPRAQVEEWVTTAGGRVLDVTETTSAGPTMASYRYTVVPA